MLLAMLEAVMVSDLAIPAGTLTGILVIVWGMSSWVRGSKEKDREHDGRSLRIETTLTDHETRIRELE